MVRERIFRAVSWTIVLSAAATLATSGIRAEDEKEGGKDAPRRARLFERLDTDDDGKISKEEASASDRGAALFERLLRRADEDGDGVLSRDEFRKGIASDRPGRGRPGERGRRGRAGARRGGQAGPALRRLFQRLDSDGDDRISKAELEKGDLPETRKRFVANLLQRADRNGDELVTRRELAAALRQGDRPDPKAIIRRFDKNGDGKIARDELELDQLPEGRRRFVANLFERGDKDGNGELTAEEIAAAFPDAPPRRRAGRARADAPRPFGRGGPLFAVLDMDGDGKVSRRELMRLSKHISRIDEDGDEALSLPEFAAAARRKAAGELDLGAAGEKAKKKERKEKKKGKKEKAAEEGEKKRPTRVF